MIREIAGVSDGHCSPDFSDAARLLNVHAYKQRRVRPGESKVLVQMHADACLRVCPCYMTLVDNR